MSIEFKLSSQNIGPLFDFSSNQQIGSCKIGIFANNGSGKTFLSRMFRLATSNDYKHEQLDNLLTINKNNGHFVFELNNSEESGIQRLLTVDLTRDSLLPMVSNETGYIFHVFNSDYVHENIEEREYGPNVNIEGYILGKGNIDLSREKRELAALIVKQNNLILDIKSSIEVGRKELSNLGIRANLGEYKTFNYDSFISGVKINEAQSFSSLKELHNDLKAMPDDLPDILPLARVPGVPDFSELQDLLLTAYSRSSIAEDFVTKVKSKQSFIEEGLQLSEKTNCPFCEQPYSVAATELIQKYNDYLKDKEAAVSKSCKKKKSEMANIINNIENVSTSSHRSSREFDKIKKYIPSMKDDEFLQLQNTDELSKSIETLCSFLDDKAQHIDKVDFAIKEQLHKIESFFSDFEDVHNQNSKKLNQFNVKKNNIQEEKRELDRRLCRALFIETKNALTGKLQEVLDLVVEIDARQLDILTREAQVRVEKKRRVAESLVQFLDLFFAGKYCFDEERFSLTFQGQVLNQKISSILSDGEKSIVAFCHYLAETHLHLSNEEDYKNLFFIIDDPISSLDFHFVYAVAQVIRNVGKYFQLKGHPRFMVFTHNIEFMSILMRNKVIKQSFVLSSKKLEKLNNQLIMPYEAHLKDIYAIARNGASPLHTTANSIRHVLETINRFDAPQVKLGNYIENIEELQGNEFIYSLMHDGSHGMIRTDKAFTDGMIQRGCEAVIKFIDNKFVSQIEHVAG